MYTYSDTVAIKSHINFLKHHKKTQHKQTEKQTKQIYKHRMKLFLVWKY